MYQTEFDQSPNQACAIDLPELNYGSWSNYLMVGDLVVLRRVNRIVKRDFWT